MVSGESRISVCRKIGVFALRSTVPVLVFACQLLWAKQTFLLLPSHKHLLSSSTRDYALSESISPTAPIPSLYNMGLLSLNKGAALLYIYDFAAFWHFLNPIVMQDPSRVPDPFPQSLTDKKTKTLSIWCLLLDFTTSMYEFYHSIPTWWSNLLWNTMKYCP